MDTLYAYGVTALYSLMATTAAPRLGVTPTLAHLDTTSFHVDGRYHSAEEPDAHVIHLTRGYSRAHRPARNQVMRALIVEQQAGIPLLQPLSGNTSAAIDCRHVVTEHIAQLHTTYGTADLVADSALYHAENLQQLAQPRSKWITRVPAPLREAQAALAEADPATMEPLMEGYRCHSLASTYGGVAQRWALISSLHRRPQAQRTIEQQLLRQGAAAVKAFKQLSRTAFACAADAQQAVATFAQGLQATSRHEVAVRPTLRSAKRGRPGQATVPDARGYPIQGALNSSLAVRDALVAQHRCFVLATHALDARALSPQELLAG